MESAEQKMLKNLFQSTWKTEFTKSMPELYTDDNKSKYSSSPEDIFKSSKKIMKNFTPRTQLKKLLLLNLSAKLLTERKYLIKTLTFVRQKYL